MAWELTGNAGIGPTSFLGTTDNEPLIIKTNGTEALRVDAGGNVGIGTTTAPHRLSVAANFDGDGIELIGSQSQTKDVGVALVDEVGNVGGLGLVSAPNAFMTGVSPGDIVLFSVRGNVWLGAGGATATPTLGIFSDGNVSIGTTDLGARLEVRGGGYGITSRGTDVCVYTQNITVPYNRVFLATTEIAGDFYGNVVFRNDISVTGDVILTGADCAEEFDVAEEAEIEPGTVVVLDQDGVLHQSHQAYDKRVAGVVSGAGDYRPGLILDRRQSHDNRLPVALVGKVYCKVDAQYAPIEVGDLLTTSPTPGHAMKADDPFKAFGAVIGKALRTLEAGQGTIPILIALQ